MSLPASFSATFSAPDGAEFFRLKEGIGGLFLAWARVEAELVRAVAALDGAKLAPAHGLARLLERWARLHEPAAACHRMHRALVEGVMSDLWAALEMRNQIAHGLRGLGAAREGQGTRLITDLNGAHREIGLDELRATVRGLDRDLALIGALTEAAAESNPARAAVLCAEIERLHPRDPALHAET